VTTVGIVIPCFNEAQSLPELLQRIKKCYHSQIYFLLVDNGSQDGTSDFLKNVELPMNVSTLRIENNQGYGYGIISGLKELKTDYVGWTHADLQTDPGDVTLFLGLINSGVDFLKGKRYGRPLTDRIFTWGMSVFVTILFKKKMSDINAQPTILRKEIFNAWKNPPYDFSLDLFAYIHAAQNKCSVERVNVNFGRRKWGNSHWNTGLVSRYRFIKRTLSMAFGLARSTK